MRSIPLHINNIVKPVSKGPHAHQVIFLSADAFGVLPPVSILNPEQAQYYFLSGFTAKLAGTERGITEPTPTFSACFGAAFLRQGNYKAGAGMDGMFLQTGRIFEPIRYPDGEILAFLEHQPERIRAKDLESVKPDDTARVQKPREERPSPKPPSLREHCIPILSRSHLL